jgi:hypothetical protein
MKRSKCSKQKEDDSDSVLSLVRNRLKGMKQVNEFGKNIAAKLRSLPTDQRIYAENLSMTGLRLSGAI